MVGDYGFDQVTPQDEEQLKRALVQKGPITVAFSISNEFFSYRDGIYTGSSQCGNTGMNHALLVVGYGTDSNGVDFWIVQNSWGT